LTVSANAVGAVITSAVKAKTPRPIVEILVFMITSLVRGAKSATAGCFEEHRPSDQYSSGQSTASNFGYV
jgi:hypothetical protein